MNSRVLSFSFSLVFALLSIEARAQGVNGRVSENQVDAIFAKYNTSTPGCSVAASVDGQPVLQKAYGMADLEHDVKNNSGATAGYRAFLTRFPDQHVSVAVLCNVSTAQAEQYGHQVADLFLAPSLKPASPPKQVSLSASDLDAKAGLYRELTTGEAMTMVHDKGALRIITTTLVPVSPTKFVANDGRILEFDVTSRAKISYSNGTVESYERVQPANPTAQELNAYVGSYTSDEAEVTMKVALRNGALEISRRPNTTIKLTPIYADTFNGGRLGTIRFHRNASGAVTELSVVQYRVWDLRFRK